MFNLCRGIATISSVHTVTVEEIQFVIGMKKGSLSIILLELLLAELRISEFKSQSNLIQGKTAFEDINWVSVGASALEGGLTSGLSAGRTLAVKASVALAGNTTKAIMDGKLNNTNDILDVAKSSITEVVSDRIIGKAGNIVGKGIKSVAPGIDKAISQKANKLILSNNKATDLAKKLPGVSNTKAARAIATSENGLVEASKTVSNTLQKVPENVTKFGLKIIKKENEK